MAHFRRRGRTGPGPWAGRPRHIERGRALPAAAWAEAGLSETMHAYDSARLLRLKKMHR